MQLKAIKCKNNTILENGRQPQVIEKWKQPQKKMQPKTIKSKDNGCGTAPGNLVSYYLRKCFRFTVDMFKKAKLGKARPRLFSGKPLS